MAKTAVDIPYTVTLDQEEGSNHISVSSHPIVPCCVVALSAWARDLLLNFRFYSGVKSRQQKFNFHGHNFPTRLQSSLRSQGEKQVFLCSQMWDCESRMRTTSACLPQHASLYASSSAPQWIWLSLEGGGAWEVVAVGGAQGKWQREIWQWAATAEVVTCSTWCGGVWCLDCHTLPWQTPPLPHLYLGPIRETRQTWITGLQKMIKGLTSSKVGDLDLWADFSKCNPCAAHIEIIQGALAKVVASWIPEPTESAFLKVGSSEFFTLNKSLRWLKIWLSQSCLNIILLIQNLKSLNIHWWLCARKCRKYRDKS